MGNKLFVLSVSSAFALIRVYQIRLKRRLLKLKFADGGVVGKFNNLHTEGVGKTTEFVKIVANYKLARQRVRERPRRQLKGDLEGIACCSK